MNNTQPHTPIQYVMGQTRFCDLSIKVNENVFIPRPETEGLVETVVSLSDARRFRQNDLRILDLCTGSGCIAIALTKAIPDCKIIASDISDDSLDAAHENAARHGVLNRIELVSSDLFNNIDGKFDIIVSNPPYIAGDEIRDLQPEVRREPRIALDGGREGLSFYKRMASCMQNYMADCGYVVLEVGFGQAESVAKIFVDNAFTWLDLRKDHNEIDRVLVFQWTN